MNSHKITRLNTIHTILSLSLAAGAAGSYIVSGNTYTSEVLSLSGALTITAMAIGNHFILEKNKLSMEQILEDRKAIKDQHHGALGIGLLVGLAVFAAHSAYTHDDIKSAIPMVFWLSSQLYAILTKYAALEDYEQNRDEESYKDGMNY